jgi:hypothetical protein
MVSSTIPSVLRTTRSASAPALFSFFEQTQYVGWGLRSHPHGIFQRDTSRVVGQHVDLAELRPSPAHQPLYPFPAGHVHHSADRCARGAGCSRHGLRRVTIQVADEDSGSFLEELPGDRPADASPAPVTMADFPSKRNIPSLTSSKRRVIPLVIPRRRGGSARSQVPQAAAVKAGDPRAPSLSIPSPETSCQTSADLTKSVLLNNFSAVDGSSQSDRRISAPRQRPPGSPSVRTATPSRSEPRSGKRPRRAPSI